MMEDDNNTKKEKKGRAETAGLKTQQQQNEGQWDHDFQLNLLCSYFFWREASVDFCPSFILVQYIYIAYCNLYGEFKSIER